MNWLQIDLSHTLARTPASFDQLSALIEPQWIEQAFEAIGKASVRRRKLPAEHMVWWVIGLALFRNQPIWHVVRQLDLTLDGQPMAVPSGAHCERVLGLRVLAVDGVVWSALDRPENLSSLWVLLQSARGR